MPKLKTHRGAAKRFKKTGTGKIQRNHAFHSHILTKKGPGRKARLDNVVTVGATRSALDADRYVGMERHVGIGERFCCSLIGLAIVDKI